MMSLSLEASINSPFSDLSSKHLTYPAIMVDFGVKLNRCQDLFGSILKTIEEVITRS
jgi:hypothetical protein